MGGGSKQTEVKAIAKTDIQKQLDQQIINQQPASAQKEAGPASRPNIDASPSPAMSKKSGKSANLNQQSIQKYPVNTSQSSGLPRDDSDMGEMQRPSATAKQFKMDASPSPKKPVKKLAQEQTQDQIRIAEQEKMKQLQLLTKQNKEKKAAAAAAKMAVPSSRSGAQKEEVFARDNSNQFAITPQQLNQPNNMLGGMNSQPLSLAVTGKGMNQQASNNMSRHESNNQFMMPTSSAAPVGVIMGGGFKMVSYNNDQDDNNWNGGQNTQSMGGGFNVGVMGGQNEMGQNREINMDELHELLGN